MQGDSDLPKAPLGNNFRPVQTLNQRFLRTNIDFRRHPVRVTLQLVIGAYCHLDLGGECEFRDETSDTIETPAPSAGKKGKTRASERLSESK